MYVIVHVYVKLSIEKKLNKTLSVFFRKHINKFTSLQMFALNNCFYVVILCWLGS